MTLPSADSQPPFAKADVDLLAAALGWALTFPVAQSALAHVSPGAYLATRIALGALVAALLARRMVVEAWLGGGLIVLRSLSAEVAPRLSRRLDVQGETAE